LGFQITKIDDNKINCVLFVNNDQLNNIEKGLAQEIVEHSGFFQSFKFAKSITKNSAMCGYMLSTQDPKVANIMVYYVDRKLQFTSDHYNSLKNMITETPANEPSRNRCTIM